LYIRFWGLGLLTLRVWTLCSFVYFVVVLILGILRSILGLSLSSGVVGVWIGMLQLSECFVWLGYNRFFAGCGFRLAGFVWLLCSLVLGLAFSVFGCIRFVLSGF